MTSLLLLKSILFANSLQKNKKKKKRKIKTKPINKDYLSMCRICNLEDGEVPIFENSIQPNIPEEIKHISGVVINQSDGLPKNMCKNCFNLLNGCILFREMCQKTNKVMIEISIKQESNDCEEKHEGNGDSDGYYNMPSPDFSDDNPELWDCSTWNKPFCNMSTYNGHISKRNDNTTELESKPSKEMERKKFLCEICGKIAYSNASLLVHKGTHENIFPFKCDVCPYRGRTMDLLKVHKRIHLVDKPFKCTQCPKATTTASNLAKHMRHVHSTARPYKCTYCEKAFSYPHDMKRHIKDIHLRQGTVECDVCNKKFNTKKILQGHKFKIHKIKGVRQGRIPSYLQCQTEDQNENNINECDSNYEK